MQYSSIILAAEPKGLFDTALGGLIVALLRAVALIVLLIGAAKAISSFTSGTPGKGAKIILGTAVVCAFLFQPTLVESLISFMGTIVKTVIGSGADIANSVTPTSVVPAP
jgi:hypothetical protein